MEGLVRIWEWECEGVKVQFIQMREPSHRWNVVDNMDVSICKAWCREDMSIHLHQDFKITVISNVMFLKDGYTWERKHAQKMRERFANYSRGSKEDAISALVWSTLNGRSW